MRYHNLVTLRRLGFWILSICKQGLIYLQGSNVKICMYAISPFVSVTKTLVSLYYICVSPSTLITHYCTCGLCFTLFHNNSCASSICWTSLLCNCHMSVMSTLPGGHWALTVIHWKKSSTFNHNYFSIGKEYDSVKIIIIIISSVWYEKFWPEM